MSKEKKTLQLGMNPSTASGRLVKDLLFKYMVEAGHNCCYHCGNEMSREDFSIEHKEPWLDSDNPVGLYFDLNNVTLSHLKCNVGSARPTKVDKGCGKPYMATTVRCSCEKCKTFRKNKRAKYYTTESRRERYKRTGN